MRRCFGSALARVTLAFVLFELSLTTCPAQKPSTGWQIAVPRTDRFGEVRRRGSISIAGDEGSRFDITVVCRSTAGTPDLFGVKIPKDLHTVGMLVDVTNLKNGGDCDPLRAKLDTDQDRRTLRPEQGCRQTRDSIHATIGLYPMSIAEMGHLYNKLMADAAMQSSPVNPGDPVITNAISTLMDGVSQPIYQLQASMEFTAPQILNANKLTLGVNTPNEDPIDADIPIDQNLKKFIADCIAPARAEQADNGVQPPPKPREAPALKITESVSVNAEPMPPVKAPRDQNLPAVRNQSRSKDQLTNSCRTGMARSCTELALTFYPRTPTAVELLTKACNLNDSRGCEVLGNYYYFGQVVGQNTDKAMQLEKKACSLGGSQASCSGFTFK